MAKNVKKFTIVIESQKMRWLPDPNRRGRIIPNKRDKEKIYSRKGRNNKGFDLPSIAA